MDKKGFIRFFVFAFLLLAFLLFAFLRSQGFVELEITGFAVSEIFGVDEVVLSRVEITSSGNLEAVAGNFHKYDLLGCAFDYNGDKNSTTAEVGFYFQDGGPDNPDEVFADAFRSESEDFLCDEVNSACVAYFNVTSYQPGIWNCFVRWGNNTAEDSDGLLMVNSPPVFRGEVPDISIEVDGSYSQGEEQIDLDDYFEDLEDDYVTYGSVGQLHVLVRVDDDGLVYFDNLEGYEGVETIMFRAHDGSNGTFSNDVVVVVGSGTVDNLAACNAVWDCDWGPCLNGQKVCRYFDRNSCGNNTNKPVDLVESCSEVTAQTAAAAEPIQLTGTLEIEKPLVAGAKRSMLLIGLAVFVLLIVIVLAVLFLKQAKKKKSGEEIKSEAAVSEEKFKPVKTAEVQAQQEQKTANVDELINYVESVLGSGQNADKLRTDLIGAGWQKSDVDYSLSFANLKRFVKSKLDAGFDKEKIIQSLKAKGWKDDLINAVFSNLGK